MLERGASPTGWLFDGRAVVRFAYIEGSDEYELQLAAAPSVRLDRKLVDQATEPTLQIRMPSDYVPGVKIIKPEWAVTLTAAPSARRAPAPSRSSVIGRMGFGGRVRRRAA